MNKTEEIKKNLKDNRIFLLIIFVFVFMSLTSSAFLTSYNIRNVARDISIPGILSCGVLMLMVSGNFDLSVGATLGLAGAISAKLSVYGYPLLTIFLIIILFGFVIGLINGLMVGYLKINSLITTLSMMFILRSILILMLGSRAVFGMSDNYIRLAEGSLGLVPIEFIYLLVVAVLSYFFLQKSVFGRHIYIIGSSEKSAFLAGTNINLHLLVIYIIVGILSALAGIIYTAHYNVAVGVAGDGLEITVMTAVVVGGANLFGGRGTILRTIAGVLILEMIFNALALHNVDPSWVSVVQGLIIMVAVAVDVISNKKEF